MSEVTAVASPPAALILLTVVSSDPSSGCSPSWRVRAAAITFPPSAAKTLAISAPMPRLAPVMTHTFPSSLPMSLLLRSRVMPRAHVRPERVAYHSLDPATSPSAVDSPGIERLVGRGSQGRRVTGGALHAGADKDVGHAPHAPPGRRLQPQDVEAGLKLVLLESPVHSQRRDVVRLPVDDLEAIAVLDDEVDEAFEDGPAERRRE